MNTSAPLTGIEYEYNDIVSACQDSTLLGTFTENQDQPRLANYTNDVSLLKNALAFALLTDGIPIIYYGAEQQFSGQVDPYNREALWLSGYNTSMPLYGHIAAINAARNAVANATTYEYWSAYWTWKSKMILVKDEVLVVRKGYDHSIVTVMTNRGQDSPDLGPYTIGDTNFLAGDTIIDVLGCTTQTVQDYGKQSDLTMWRRKADRNTGVITSTVTKGLPQVWISTSLMVNSNVCPHVKKVAAVLKTLETLSAASASPPSLLMPAAVLAACIFSLLGS